MSVKPNLKGITFPSDHQYVVVDTSETVKYKDIQRLPMTFEIDYSRVEDSNLAVRIPMLTLLINPENIEFNFAKRVTPSFTRDGYIIEEFGESQDIIKCSGRIGAYYIYKGNGMNSPEGYSGINRYDRTKSLSFKNLYSLLYIFRNNGVIFQNTTMAVSNDRLIQNSESKTVTKRIQECLGNARNRIDRVGDVYLKYDKTSYMGAFDNFSMSEDAKSPYTLTFNFQFTVQRRVITDFRNFEYYNKTSYENTLTKETPNQNVERKIRDAIQIQKESLKIESGTFNTITNENYDIPLAEDDSSSKMSAKRLAIEGTYLLKNNEITPTLSDRENYEKAIEKLNLAMDTKDYKLKREGEQELILSVYNTIKKQKNVTEQEAISKASNLSKIMYPDLNKTYKSDDWKQISPSSVVKK